MKKKLTNILHSWETVQYPASDGPGVLRIRGRAVIDQPEAGIAEDDMVITSCVVRITVDGNRRILETANSRYILCDNNPFKGA